MRFSIFNFLQVLCFAAPFGCALPAGLKQGVSGGLIGLVVGLTIGVATICCVSAAIRFVGRRALRLESEALRETTVASLFVGGLALLTVATLGAMRVTDQVTVVFTRAVP